METAQVNKHYSTLHTTELNGLERLSTPGLLNMGQQQQQQQQQANQTSIGAVEEPKTSASGVGRHVLIKLVDEIAASDPLRPFVFIPKSVDLTEEWKPVTFGELSNAINHVAHKIHQLPQNLSDEQFPTVAYIGPNDVRYMVVLMACIKAGSKAFFVSPRNTLAAQLSLFKATNCNAVCYAESYHSVVSEWLDQRQMAAIVAPSLEEWLKSSAKPFPYDRAFEEARWDPLVVLHTSGTTGIPKPIVVKQGGLCIADSFRNLPEIHGARYFHQAWKELTKRIFYALPLFHTAGALGLLSTSIYYGVPFVMPPSDRPLSVDLVIECLKYSGADSTMLPPALVEGLSSIEEGLAAATNMKFVGWGGGNLAPAAGQRLVDRGVTLNSVIGSTENFPYPVYFNADPDTWNYFIFNSEAMGADWRPAGDNVFELVFRRKDATDPRGQVAFFTFPGLSEWSTKDLFQPHPTLKDHWLYKGRIDNVIVFSNGEKLNPVTMEETIMGHASIKGALVVGQDRFQPGLILEPKTPPEDDVAAEALIQDVWPLVEQANKETSAHGRIVRDLIALADPSRPFLRAGKGSVQRGLTVDLYKDLVDSIYEKFASEQTTDFVDLDIGDEQMLTQSIIDLFVSKIGVKSIGRDTDFFAAGIDSLQVLSVSHLLRASFEASGVQIDPTSVSTRVIYRNPTPERLATYLYCSLNKNGEAEPDELTQEVQKMEQILAKYTKDLPEPNPKQMDPLDHEQTILLTGTTGSLGAYLLDRLCSSPHVKKIVALNRGQDGGVSRQPSASEFRGLGLDFSKVEFLGVNLALPEWGLGEVKYSELLASADRIIHNAWPVNFNINIASFEPHIRGVRHLVDFSSKATKRVPIVFLSSIGTVDGWTAPGSVPERQLNDLALPRMGYGRSKLLGSLILDEAAEQSGIHTASVRVGQIAGPRGLKGVWNRQEYLPSLVASSAYLGVLPDHLGPNQVVDWIPIEDMAGLVLDVAGVTRPVPLSDISGYFHGINPAKTEWSELALAVKEHFNGRIERLVSLEHWVSALEASVGETVDAEQNPGIKLLDTYKAMLKAQGEGQGYVRLDVERTKSRSEAMRNLGPVTPELMQRWCRQWNL